MNIRNAGTFIRQIRKASGRTQEQFSGGYCSPYSLSRIENNTAGISLSLFQSLMEHNHIPISMSPVFTSYRDYETDSLLTQSRLYLDSWKLDFAYAMLKKAAASICPDNKPLRQTYILLYCLITLRSGKCNFYMTKQYLLDAFYLTQEHVPVPPLSRICLSRTEIELLISVTDCYIHLNELNQADLLGSSLSVLIENATFSDIEINFLKTKLSVVLCKLKIGRREYEPALILAEQNRRLQWLKKNYTFLHELTFLASIAYQNTGNASQALELFQSVFYSSYSLKSCYATRCRNYIKDQTNLVIPGIINALPDIPLKAYARLTPAKKNNSNETRPLPSKCNYTLGSLIRDIRMEKKITQAELCLGLCNKSKLSKIENAALQPDAFFAETLLERLGTTSQSFLYFGSQKDVAVNTLRIKINQSVLHGPETVAYLSLLEALIPEKDHINRQFCLYHRALLNPEPYETVCLLEQSLHLTLPDFKINYINNYKLSGTELTILNLIGFSLAKTKAPSSGINYLYHIIEYLEEDLNSVTLNTGIYPVTAVMLFHHLCLQKRYAEILEASHMLDKCSWLHSLPCLAGMYFYYSLALEKCGHAPKTLNTASYAYWNARLIGNQKEPDTFKKRIFK